MRNLVFCILLCIVYSSKAQSIFTRTYGAPGSFNEGKSVGLTADSGYVIFGSTGGWGAVNGDMLLIKTDSFGIQKWAKTYGSNNTEQGVSMKICADKGYIMAGNTNNSADGNYDIYLVKTDSLGDTIWTRTIGGSNWDFCSEVIESPDGSFYLLLNSNAIDTYENIITIFKLDANGSELWNTNFSIGEGNKANALISYNSDSLLFCGKSFNILTNSEDVFVTMINSNGDSLWTYFYGDQRKEWANSLVKNIDGNIAVSANRLMAEGNRRPFLLSIYKNGNVQYNEFVEGVEDIECKNIKYNPLLYNTYNIAIEFNTDFNSAGIFNLTNSFIYRCSNVIDGLGNSKVGEIVVNNDSSCTAVGTAYYLTPGQSSIFLLKLGTSCERSNTISLSIENQEENKSTVFPNPANDVLMLNESIKDVVSIFNIAGQSVTFIHNQNYISTKYLNNGIYFLSYINNLNQVKTIKFLIFHP